MSPIRKGDGTELSATGYSEVRKGDGTVLWRMIPKSHQWRFSEGSGTSVADSIGSADGTLNGEFWTSGTWIDGWALAGDGSGNYVDTGPNDGITGEIAIAITVRINSFPEDNSAKHIAAGGFDGSQTAWELQLDGSDDALVVQSYDGSTGHRTAVPFSELSTGIKYRIIGQYRSGDWEIWIDSSLESSTTDDTGAISTSANRTFLALDADGNAINFADVVIDNPIIAETGWSSDQVQTDYETQPWS